MKKIYLFLFFFVFPAISLGEIFPEKALPSEELPLNIKADTLTYEQDKNLYTAQGKVEIVQGNRNLKADLVTLNSLTKETVAIGNVVYMEGKDILRSERLELNLDTQKGIVFEGRMFWDKEHFHLTGKRIEKLGEKTYHIIDGTFTTCDGDPPPWKFRGKEIEITLEGYAKVKGASFYVKNIPLLYSPYLVFPAKKERQSGFLLPRIGYSNTEGAEIDNAFFWAISKNTDATFYLDYHSKKGIGEGLEYRYVLSPDSSGVANGYYISEKKSYQESYTEILDREKERWKLEYEGGQNLLDFFSAKAHLSLISDRQFFRDYGKGDEQTKEKNKSNLFLSKSWPNYNLTTEFEYNQDLIKKDETTLQKLPHISFIASSQPFFNTPLFFSLDNTYNYFWREEGLKGQRLDLYPKISWPTNYYNYFKFTPTLGGRETLYFGLTEERDKEKNREIFDFNGELSTTFQRVFFLSEEGQGLRKIKHSLKPEITYTYIPKVDQKKLPEFDEVDRIERKETIGYSLTNNLIGKIYESEEMSYEQELLYLKIAQSYNLIEARRELTSSKDSRRPFSNVYLELRSKPLEYVTLKFDTQYNTYDNRFEVYNTRLDLRDKRGDSLGLEHRYEKGGNRQLNTDLRVKVLDTLDFTFYNRYSQSASLSLETIWGLDYHPQCWGVQLTYSEKTAEAGKPSERRYMLMFSLTGIGKVGKVGGLLD